MATCVILTGRGLGLFVTRILEDNQFAFYGPVQENDHFAFREIESVEQIELGYDRAYFSPTKEHLLPPCEVIARFNGSGYVPAVDARKTILFGVHPYDIKALDVLDAVYAKGKWPDPGYCKRREKLLIIGMDVLFPPEDSFCADADAHTVDHGFDLMLTCIGENEDDDRYVVEIGSDEGETLLRKYLGTIGCPCTEKDLEARRTIREDVEGTYPFTLSVPKEELATLLETEKGKAVLAEMVEKCIACGNCTKVCPTCMCYTIHDTATLDGTSDRVRTRSSCIFNCSAMVAGEHNFRKTAEERLKNRLLDKTKFVPQEHGVFGCVGCGRCGICPAGVAHLAEIFAYMKEEK